MKYRAGMFLGMRLLVLVGFFILPGFAAAAPSEEIPHLLAYIEESGCAFIRNGKTYSAVDGRHHIERKYEYLKKKIGSTEDFIKYAATGSSMSGSPYMVNCNGKEMLSGEWLIAELKHFREQLRNGVAGGQM